MSNRDAVLEALARKTLDYCEHEPECARREDEAKYDTECTCGLATLRAEWEVALQSPKTEVPVGLETLVRKWREQATRLIEGGNGWEPQPWSERAATKKQCADELEAALQSLPEPVLDHLNAGDSMATAPSDPSAGNELELVQLVISAHQTAYARFHNGEGRRVIESDDMAKGYASVELAKALKRLRAAENRQGPDVTELAEHITYKIQSLLTEKYTNSFKIACGIIEQELRKERP